MISNKKVGRRTLPWPMGDRRADHVSDDDDDKDKGAAEDGEVS